MFLIKNIFRSQVQKTGVRFRFCFLLKTIIRVTEFRYTATMTMILPNLCCTQSECTYRCAHPRICPCPGICASSSSRIGLGCVKESGRWRRTTVDSSSCYAACAFEVDRSAASFLGHANATEKETGPCCGGGPSQSHETKQNETSPGTSGVCGPAKLPA